MNHDWLKDPRWVMLEDNRPAPRPPSPLALAIRNLAEAFKQVALSMERIRSSYGLCRIGTTCCNCSTPQEHTRRTR